MYNFEVDDCHTYYVGEQGIWVHNTNCTETVSTKEVALERQVVKQEALNDLNNSCFIAGTLVHTKEGLKPIETLQIGDLVLSYPDTEPAPAAYRNEREHLYKYRPIKNVFVHDDQPITMLTVWDLANNIKETIHTAPNHPIYVKNRGWLEAEKLKWGNSVKDYDFADVLVKKILPTQQRAQVFNIEVDEFHTYFVGELGVWVHNKNIEGQPVELTNIRTRTTEIEIYKDSSFENRNPKDSTQNTGRLSEELGKDAMEASTGLEFRNELRNNSNNGPDLWHLDTSPLAAGKPAQLIVVDVKGSLYNNYSSVEGLGLNTKVERRMTEGSQGILNRQILPENVTTQFREAYDLWQAGKLEITTAEKISLYTKRFFNKAEKDTNQNTGNIGKRFAKMVMETETGLKFLDQEVRHGRKTMGRILPTEKKVS